MIKTSCVKVLLCWCFLLTTCFAQQISPITGVTSRRQESRIEQVSRPPRDALATRPASVKRFPLPAKKKISREQKKLLQPDAADLNQYAAFLQNPNTGIIKLFPDVGCEDNANVIRIDADCLKSIPMSAFYSFREEEYTTDLLSDIRLENDVLIADGILSQGILTALGDVALEDVSLSSSGMNFLAEYKPETQSGEVLKQTLQLAKGIKSGEYWYGKALPAKENTTYALRVIAYRANLSQPSNAAFYYLLAGDERVDITVVFRLLRKDKETGSITLLWKELSREDAPKVVFPKKSKKQLRNGFSK